MRERERDRGRQREIERDKLTERERHTHTQRDTHRETHTETHTHRDRDTDTERQRKIERPVEERHTYLQPFIDKGRERGLIFGSFLNNILCILVCTLPPLRARAVCVPLSRASCDTRASEPVSSGFTSVVIFHLSSFMIYLS